MNALIKELAKRSELVKYDSDSKLAEVEKFAELIIKECLEVIADESDKVSVGWRCKDGQHIWWKLTQHFGIKE